MTAEEKKTTNAKKKMTAIVKSAQRGAKAVELLLDRENEVL